MERKHAYRGVGRWVVRGLGLACVGIIVGCGSAAEVSGDVASDNDAAAGAVATLFGSSASGNLAKFKVVRVEKVESADHSTCENVLNGNVSEGGLIATATFGAAGDYGSLNHGVTVSADDYCASSAAPTELNTGSGFDGKGLVATFTLSGDITTNCSDATIVMQAGSTGIWRNTSAEQTDVAYAPQVWGRFNFLVNGEAVTLDCTLYLGEDETILFADCSDESGTVVDQDTSATCQVHAD